MLVYPSSIVSADKQVICVLYLYVGGIRVETVILHDGSMNVGLRNVKCVYSFLQSYREEEVYCEFSPDTVHKNINMQHKTECVFLSFGLAAVSGCFFILYTEIKFPFQGVYSLY